MCSGNEHRDAAGVGEKADVLGGSQGQGRQRACPGKLRQVVVGFQTERRLAEGQEGRVMRCPEQGGGLLGEPSGSIQAWAGHKRAGIQGS